MENANVPDSYVTDHNRDLASRLSSPTASDLAVMEEKLQEYDRVDKHKVKIEKDKEKEKEHPGAAALEDAMTAVSTKGRKDHKRAPDKQPEGSESDSSNKVAATSFIPSVIFRDKLRALSPIKSPPVVEETTKKKKKSPKKSIFAVKIPKNTQIFLRKQKSFTTI